MQYNARKSKELAPAELSYRFQLHHSVLHVSHRKCVLRSVRLRKILMAQEALTYNKVIGA